MKIGEIERIGERELPLWVPREIPAEPEPAPTQTEPAEEEVPA